MSTAVRPAEAIETGETARGFRMLNFIISHRCNIKCKSCINGDAQKSHLRLKDEEIFRVIDETATLGSVRLMHFSGGEPFLHFETMKSAARHAKERFGWSSAATTSGYWAKNQDVALHKLSELKAAGFKALGLSIDEFHEQFLDQECIRNALLAARELRLVCRIQTAVTRSSKTVEDYRQSLQVEAPDLFRWQDVPCIPLGYAAQDIGDDFFLQEGVPMGDCTMGAAITIFPDGSVSLCSTSRQCSALTFGNIRRAKMPAVVEAADKSPTFNALMLWWGPRLLADQLADEGDTKYSGGSYAHVCHSCYSIMENKRAVETLRRALDPLRDELRDERIAQRQNLKHIAQRPPWIMGAGSKGSDGFESALDASDEPPRGRS